MTLHSAFLLLPHVAYVLYFEYRFHIYSTVLAFLFLQ